MTPAVFADVGVPLRSGNVGGGNGVRDIFRCCAGKELGGQIDLLSAAANPAGHN